MCGRPVFVLMSSGKLTAYGTHSFISILVSYIQLSAFVLLPD